MNEIIIMFGMASAISIAFIVGGIIGIHYGRKESQLGVKKGFVDHLGEK